MSVAARARTALGLIVCSLTLVWLTSLVGADAASRYLPGQGALPPYTLGRKPSTELVTAVLWLATIVGAVGVARAWSALRAGWTPSPRRLVAGALLGAVAFVLVPPVTNDDVYSYAAYGYLEVHGHDPYQVSPGMVGGPVTDAVGRSWRDAPSVYGPVATGEQTLVLRVAGDDLRRAMFGFSLAAFLAFAACVLLLDRLAADDAGRRRAALLFGLNPLVAVPLVAAAHLDGLVVAGVLAAVLLWRRDQHLGAGIALGAAAGVKPVIGVAALGLAWLVRSDRRRLATFALGGAAVLVPGYLAVGGWSALTQSRQAAHYVTLSSPWRALVNPLDDWLGHGASRNIVTALSLAAVVALVVRFARGLTPGPAEARIALVPVLAWLLGATYVLSWYDTWAWALLALLAWSAWDRLLLVHATVLTLAYLPGREVAIPYPLSSVLDAIRRVVAPIAIGGVVAAAVWISRDRRPAASRTRAAPLP